MTTKWGLLDRIRRSDRSGYWLVLPYVLFFCAFVAYPLIFSIILIFHRWNIVSPMQWIGLRNFTRLVEDPLFWKSLLQYTDFSGDPHSVAGARGDGAGTASELQDPGRGFFRAVYFLPVVVSGVAVTILWQQLYSYDYGVLNGILARLHIPPVPWLVDPGMAMPSIAIMATWKNVGIYIVLFLVGLQNIPKELYEAASLDGAKPSGAVSAYHAPHAKSNDRCHHGPLHDRRIFALHRTVCAHGRRPAPEHPVRDALYLQSGASTSAIWGTPQHWDSCTHW